MNNSYYCGWCGHHSETNVDRCICGGKSWLVCNLGCAAQHHAHLTPESLASSQAVVNASALEQLGGDTPPAQAQVA